jgi:hypothetical protein
MYQQLMYLPERGPDLKRLRQKDLKGQDFDLKFKEDSSYAHLNERFASNNPIRHTRNLSL